MCVCVCVCVLDGEGGRVAASREQCFFVLLAREASNQYGGPDGESDPIALRLTTVHQSSSLE